MAVPQVCPALPGGILTSPQLRREEKQERISNRMCSTPNFEAPCGRSMFDTGHRKSDVPRSDVQLLWEFLTRPRFRQHQSVCSFLGHSDHPLGHTKGQLVTVVNIAAMPAAAKFRMSEGHSRCSAVTPDGCLVTCFVCVLQVSRTGTVVRPGARHSPELFENPCRCRLRSVRGHRITLRIHADDVALQPIGDIFSGSVHPAAEQPRSPAARLVLDSA